MRAALAIALLLIKEIFRKKDFYVALFLMGVILAYASQMKFYEVRSVTRYLLDLGLTLVFFLTVILAVSLGARQVPSEAAGRTLQVLLAKPVTRGQFLLGKFLGTFLAAAAAFGVFAAVFFGAAFAKGASFEGVLLAQAGFCFLLNLAVVSAMAVGLSPYLTVSANVSLTLVTYLAINLYGPGLKDAGAALAPPLQAVTWTLYYFLPHFEFFDLRQRLVHRWGALSPKLLLFLAAYAALYAAAFLVAGWLGLRRRKV